MIYLWTWIVQIGILISFETGPLLCDQSFFQMFIPASKKIQSIRIVSIQRKIGKKEC